jgi:hypothetical protein
MLVEIVRQAAFISAGTPHDDQGHDPFPETVVGHADHHGVGHVGSGRTGEAAASASS